MPPSSPTPLAPSFLIHLPELPVWRILITWAPLGPGEPLLGLQGAERTFPEDTSGLKAANVLPTSPNLPEQRLLSRDH